jgi:hypothetical protein
VAKKDTVHQRLQSRKSKFTGQDMLCFKGGRRLLTKMETTLKNNDAFSNIVVKVCKMFICPTCKEHEIKNRRHYFLTAPCKMIYRDLQKACHCCQMNIIYFVRHV